MTAGDFQVGEIVLPEEFREFEGAFRNYNLRITHVFKSGNIRAKTDAGHACWNGPAEGFYRPDWD